MNSVKLARYRAGQSVKAAATAVGLSTAAIYGYERGDGLPSAATAKALADFYGTTVDSLLGLSEPGQEAA